MSWPFPPTSVPSGTTPPPAALPGVVQPPPGRAPVATCGGDLPAAFVSNCSACHTAVGAANSRYPDLYAYQGSAGDFVAKVRGGGNGMPAYPASAISDDELGHTFDHFRLIQRAGLDSVALGDVRPLFAPADAVNPPIVFTRDDGVLVTRGAGRVRGRHEGPQATNLEFMEFVFNYFESRSYGFIVEDFTPTGVSRIRVTYLPIASPTNATNFRTWKKYSANDTFNDNGMLVSDAAMPPLGRLDTGYATGIAPFARIQQGESVRNQRDGRDIQRGDLFEFEFGVFIDGASVKPMGSRTAYYTDTFRYQVGQGGLTANSPDPYGGAGLLGPTLPAQQGGGTTNVWPYHLPETAFGQMALNVQHENVQHFLEGRRLFHTSFATGEHSEPGNPPFPEQIGKAGPRLDAPSCETCHLNNGPGALIAGALDDKSSMVFKLHGGPHKQFALQDGTVTLTGFDQSAVVLDDGTSVALRRPRFDVPGAARFSARLARKVIGSGLLEALDERSLLARAACGSEGGISGRPSYVADPRTGERRLGRFGWKAEKVSVQHQIAEALSVDMGVGTTLFPEGGKVELPDEDLARITTYMRLVSVPGQRDHDAPPVVQGEQIFKTIGCAVCHVTDAVTGANHPFAELRSQAIKPYTDLLLHDLGPDLADDSGVPAPATPDDPPGASEWRTPPLWGLGLYATINGHVGLLHDGRAASPLEAVLWHGGEAEAVKRRVMALPASDRAALLAFLQSL
jgi:CxxC motif-containing protein (DUF1111 family)